MGVKVLATCLTKQGEQDLKSMTSDKLKTFQVDVTDSQQIKEVFEQVKNVLPSGQGKILFIPHNDSVKETTFPNTDGMGQSMGEMLENLVAAGQNNNTYWLSHSIVSRLIFVNFMVIRRGK